MAVKIQVRRGTASTWTSANPTLSAGEIGFETDTNKIKIGDGSTAWTSLGYTSGGVSYATTATAAGTTTLTSTSATSQFFTGTTTQTVVLPVASTLQVGASYYINNNSTGIVTVQSSGGNTVLAMPGNTTAIFTCILASGTTAASWDADYTGATTITGTGSLVLATSPALVTPDLGTPSALNLTNATSLPVSGITSSTTTALGVGSLELGHASDTTISRASAGRIAVEGVNVVTTSSSDTLTNKTLSSAVLTGTVTANASAGTNGQYLQTTGTGVQWASVSSYSAPTLGSTSIASGATVTTIAGLTLSGATLTGSLTASSSTGTSGQYLQSTGTGVQWATVTTDPTPTAVPLSFMLMGA